MQPAAISPVTMSMMLMPSPFRTTRFATPPRVYFPQAIPLPQPQRNKADVLGLMSMIGTIIQTVQLPRIPYLGWSLSLPDYIHCVASQSDTESKKEVLFCRLPAKIVSQFSAAEIGYFIGAKLFPRVKPYLPKVISHLPKVAMKSIGGLAALFALTPIMEGRIADRLVGIYRTHHQLQSDVL